MRRFLALSCSAALEALAEPVSAILFLVSLLTIHLVPVFHCHQFGAPERLPMECGFSALMVFGLVFATAAAVRTIGREIESGTAAAALARPVSRSLFFCAKCGGVLGAFLLFALAVSSATLLAMLAAEMGAVMAVEEGLSRVWGPGVALGVGMPVVAFALAAAGNRFLRARFCVTASLLTAVTQPLAGVLALAMAGEGVEVAWRILPPFAVLFLGCAVMVVFAASCAVCVKAAAVTALVVAALVASFVWPIRWLLPDFTLFWQVDGLVGGESAVVGGDALAAGILLLGFWLLVGSILMTRRELS